jgi:hypothetical protein
MVEAHKKSSWVVDETHEDFGVMMLRQKLFLVVCHAVIFRRECHATKYFTGLRGSKGHEAS